MVSASSRLNLARMMFSFQELEAGSIKSHTQMASRSIAGRTRKVDGLGNHGSSLIFMQSPFPTLNLIPFCRTLRASKMPFHPQEVFFPLPASLKDFPGWYLSRKTIAKGDDELRDSRHPILARSAKLKH
ncbi:hypothetical protein ACFX16_009691 [Malus domestica]